MMKKPTLFHRTSPDRAAAIMRDGFKDGEGSYLTDAMFRGVWLASRPLDANDGAGPISGESVVLAVDFLRPLSDLDDYEWIQEGNSYREWCIPAEVINQHATIRLLRDDEEE